MAYYHIGRGFLGLSLVASIFQAVLVLPAHADHDGTKTPHSAETTQTTLSPDAKSFAHGQLTFTSPWARATVKGAKVGAGYLMIVNAGEDDTLIKASTDVSERVEIHEMKMVGDVMKMRELENGLPIPAKDGVELKPGGYHLMLMNLKRPLKEGEVINLKLTFAKSGDVEVPFDVKSLAASSPQGKAKHQ